MLLNGRPSSWSQWLHWSEYWYNTSFHSSTKWTPFKGLYGRHPPPIIRFLPIQAAISSLEEQMIERDAILDDLENHLLKAQVLNTRWKCMQMARGMNLCFQLGIMYTSNCSLIDKGPSPIMPMRNYLSATRVLSRSSRELDQLLTSSNYPQIQGSTRFSMYLSSRNLLVHLLARVLSLLNSHLISY